MWKVYIFENKVSRFSFKIVSPNCLPIVRFDHTKHGKQIRKFRLNLAKSIHTNLWSQSFTLTRPPVFHAYTELSRERDAHAKRTSPSNEWRLTNLTFHGAPLRGHQCRTRLMFDHSVRLPPIDSRTCFLFLFTAICIRDTLFLLSCSRLLAAYENSLHFTSLAFDRNKRYRASHCSRIVFARIFCLSFFSFLKSI